MEELLSTTPLWGHGLLILLAIICVAKGADIVVGSATELATQLGISDLVIGLTVVALGTSAPEMAVGLVAAFNGSADISVGNIVGSNIFNLGFILGGAALLCAIPTTTKLVTRDGLVLAIGALLLVVLLGNDLRLDRMDGAILLILLALYLVVLYRSRRQEQSVEVDDFGPIRPDEGSLGGSISMLSIGLIVVVGSSHLLVGSAVVTARALGVSEWVIGVTIVAAGTSMPELATTIAGVRQKRFAISAGNLIGSDIFNLLGVLGVAGLIRPLSVDPMARYSMMALVGTVFLTLFFMYTGRRVTRREGLVLVAIAGARWTVDYLSRT